MKRNWLPYVAIASALVAGTICSTALADNKGKFNLGGAARSLQANSGQASGGTRNFNSANLNSNVVRNLNSNANVVRNGQIGQQGTKVGNHVVNGQIGNRIGNHAINGQIGNKVGGHVNGGQIVKQIGGGLHNPVQGGGLGKLPIGGQPKVGIDAGKHLGTIVSGKQIHLDPAKKIGIIQCQPPQKQPCPPQPICPPKHQPAKHCFPWWSLPNYDPWHKPCYPKVCTQPIVVKVPVAVPVQVPVAVPVGVPVPAPVAEPRMQIPVGATLTLEALGLGEAAGQVMVVMDKISLPSLIHEWNPSTVTATLPVFGLAAPTPAELILMTAEGQVVSTLPVELIPAQPEMAAAGDATAAALAAAALGQ